METIEINVTESHKERLEEIEADDSDASLELSARVMEIIDESYRIRAIQEENE